MEIVKIFSHYPSEELVDSVRLRSHGLRECKGLIDGGFELGGLDDDVSSGNRKFDGFYLPIACRGPKDGSEEPGWVTEEGRF